MQVELSLKFRDVGREENVAMIIPPCKHFSWSGQWRKERDAENENAPKGMGKSESGGLAAVRSGADSIGVRIMSCRSKVK